MDFHTLSLKIARSENLPVLPAVVLNLLELFGHDNVSTIQLENIIGRDTGLTAKVLRVASSAMYGGSACEDIARAISVIGINRMKQIAVSLGYQQFIYEKSLVPAFDKMVFWEHTVLTATISREIMTILNRIKAQDAYTTGLVLDVGLLAMDRFCPDDLAKSIHMAKIQKIDLIEAEQKSCSFDHKQIGTMLAQKWGLSSYIQDTIKNHDNPTASEADKEICITVATARCLCYEMGYPPIKGLVCTQSAEELLPLLKISQEQISEIFEVALKEVEIEKQHMTGRRAA